MEVLASDLNLPILYFRGMSWLYNYQTLIVGVLGFVGVIGTLITNALLSRSQVRQIRAAEQKSLGTVAFEELDFIYMNLRIQREAIENAEPGTAVTIRNPGIGLVFKRIIEGVSVLPQDQVAMIMAAYIGLEDLDNWLKYWAEQKNEKSYYYTISVNEIEKVSKILEKTSTIIEEARDYFKAIYSNY